MILLVTNRRDITMDYIVLELQRREINYFRLNTELLPFARCAMSATSRKEWSISLDGRLVDGRRITAAYFRRPGKPVAHSCVESAQESYVEAEWAALLKSLYMRLDSLWLNSPANIVLSEDKPRQLLLASELGFKVPETRITNDLSCALEVTSKLEAIGKPLRCALVQGENEKIIFTSRLRTLNESDDAALALAPVIFQEEITKKYDVRVTVVGRRVFAVAIFSQVSDQTEVDWRKGSRPDLRHELIELPGELEQQCIRLVQMLGLKFGAIDLICDRDGQYWFLEINPNGQWAWLENLTGAPIASAIVDELGSISSHEMAI